MHKEFKNINEAFNWMIQQPKFYHKLGKTPQQGAYIRRDYKIDNVNYHRKVMLLEGYGFTIKPTLQENE
jgi:hypothetical protein